MGQLAENQAFTLELRPVTLKLCQQFIARHHRHNNAPRGWKFGVGVFAGNELVGVGVASRPVARSLDDGLTIEISRTCTTGVRNANSKLYGALCRAAAALGYVRAVTYTQHDETGSSLKATGWVRDKELPARGSWAQHSLKLRHKRCPVGNGDTERVRWMRAL